MSWETQPRAAGMPHGQHTTLTACNDMFWSILCPTQLFCVFMSWETQPRAACMLHGQHTTLTACNDILWSILCPTQLERDVENGTGRSSFVGVYLFLRHLHRIACITCMVQLHLTHTFHFSWWNTLRPALPGGHSRLPVAVYRRHGLSTESKCSST